MVGNFVLRRRASVAVNAIYDHETDVLPHQMSFLSKTL